MKSLATPKRSAAAAPSSSDARVRSAPSTTRSAVARKRDICPVPQPTSTTRASPGSRGRGAGQTRSCRRARAARQAVSRRISGKRGDRVEVTDRLGPRIARHAEIGDAVRDGVARVARGAGEPHLRTQVAPAGGAGEQLVASSEDRVDERRQRLDGGRQDQDQPRHAEEHDQRGRATACRFSSPRARRRERRSTAKALPMTIRPPRDLPSSLETHSAASSDSRVGRAPCALLRDDGRRRRAGRCRSGGRSSSPRRRGDNRLAGEVERRVEQDGMPAAPVALEERVEAGRLLALDRLHARGAVDVGDGREPVAPLGRARGRRRT